MINKKVIIRRCMPNDESALFALIEREGDEWKDYWQGQGRRKYQKALANSITYLTVLVLLVNVIVQKSRIK